MDEKKDAVAAATPTPDFSVPSGWVVRNKPTADSSEIQCANGATDKEWKVTTDDGRLLVSKYRYKKNEQLTKLPAELKKHILKNRNIGTGLAGYLHAEPYEKGWLIGSDAGEWGGKLLWFSEDEQKRIELLNENVGES